MLNQEIPVGSHVASERHFWSLKRYHHHGIYIGNGRVIHYSGMSGDRQSIGRVEEVSFDYFCKGRGYRIVKHERRLDDQKIVERAKSRIGERTYDLTNNNCEHFCYWCVEGEHESKQLNEVVMAIGTVFGIFTAYKIVEWVLLRSIYSLGSAKGLDDGGILSALQLYGLVYARLGLVIICFLLGGLAVSVIYFLQLRLIPSLPISEKMARKHGILWSWIGVVFGVVLVTALVAFLGDESGLTESGVIEGIRSLGNDDLRDGVKYVLMAPILFAGVFGFVAYHGYKNSQRYSILNEGGNREFPGFRAVARADRGPFRGVRRFWREVRRKP